MFLVYCFKSDCVYKLHFFILSGNVFKNFNNCQNSRTSIKWCLPHRGWFLLDVYYQLMQMNMFCSCLTVQWNNWHLTSSKLAFLDKTGSGSQENSSWNSYLWRCRQIAPSRDELPLGKENRSFMIHECFLGLFFFRRYPRQPNNHCTGKKKKGNSRSWGFYTQREKFWHVKGMHYYAVPWETAVSPEKRAEAV